ncbi:hypothetical protein [Vibrio phage RYC]|nr:hypothetical protein [Vibrio phage RYC]
MTDQVLKVWAATEYEDQVAMNTQRRPLEDEEFDQGWLRNDGASAQQWNQLFYLLTSASAPSYVSPVLYPTSLPIDGSVAKEMNGQGLVESESPTLFEAYGSNLPDLRGSAPTGFTYVVRNH